MRGRVPSGPEEQAGCDSEGAHNGTTRFVWGGNSDWQCLEERDGAGNLVARFTYAPGYIDAPARQERDLNADDDFGDDDEVVWYHSNTLYTVYALTDGSENVVERYRYDAYGACTVLDADFSADSDGISDVSNAYAFTARRLDPESGLMQYRHRYYAPALGRFISPDPHEHTQGGNFFEAFASRPLYYGDPQGRESLPLGRNQMDALKHLLLGAIKKKCNATSGRGNWHHSRGSKECPKGTIIKDLSKRERALFFCSTLLKNVDLVNAVGEIGVIAWKSSYRAITALHGAATKGIVEQIRKEAKRQLKKNVKEELKQQLRARFKDLQHGSEEASSGCDPDARRPCYCEMAWWYNVKTQEVRVNINGRVGNGVDMWGNTNCCHSEEFSYTFGGEAAVNRNYFTIPVLGLRIPTGPVTVDGVDVWREG